MVQALDVYARLGIGQLEAVAELGRQGQLVRRDGERPGLEVVEDAEALLGQAKACLFDFARGQSHGIYSAKLPAAFKEAWALHKLLRHRLAWDANPEGGWSVAYDDPRMLSERELEGVSVRSIPQDEHIESLEALLDQMGPGVALLREGGGWRVAQVGTGATLGTGSTPSAALRAVLAVE